MSQPKPHLEFVGVDMKNGWEVPPGYPPGPGYGTAPGAGARGVPGFV